MAMDKDEIIKKIKENKTPVFIVSVILVVFIAFSAVRCSAVQESRQAESRPQATASNVVDDEASALNELTDEQKAKQDKYDQETQRFIAVLKANLWATEDKSSLISFTDKTFIERTDQGKSATTAYVIDALKADTSKTDEETVDTYTAATELSDGTHFITLEKHTYSDQNIQYFLISDCFAKSKAQYSPISPSDNITVSGLNQEVLQLFGNDKDNIESTVKNYCAQYLPTYTEFEWAQYATINWEENTITVTFKEKDGNREILALEYNRNTKTMECHSI